MNNSFFFSSRQNTDNYLTESSRSQTETENSVLKYLNIFNLSSMSEEDRQTIANVLLDENGEVLLLRQKHIEFLLGAMASMKPSAVSLDSSQTWMIYWSINPLILLGAPPVEFYPGIIRYLEKCEAPDGGYTTPFHLPHTATTYAAVLSLCCIGTVDAYLILNRKTLYRFFMSLKQPDGSFRVHVDGEVDTRSIYCILCVCSLLNMLTPELTIGIGDFLARCITYQGGFGAVPGAEAHAGYSYCGIASLVLLGEVEKCNISDLEDWSCNCQCAFEGGFCGRTNKLVDACYSHWQASIPIICELYRSGAFESFLFDPNHKICPIMNSEHLQRYILVCAQAIGRGGLRDKPSANPDLYHTNYALCGLSYAQHYTSIAVPNIFGNVEKNEIGVCHPIYAIPYEKSNEAKSFFSKLECSHDYFLQ